MAIDASAAARGLGIGVTSIGSASTSSASEVISVPPSGGGGGGPSNQLADDSLNLIVDDFGEAVIEG